MPSRWRRQRSIPVQRVKRPALDRITDSHQGILAEVSEYPYVEIDDMLDLAQQRGEPPLILLLDVIQNPQNLGTLLRTAEAVGAHGVIIPQRRGVEVTQAVVNASSGASEHMLIAQVVNLVAAITELKEHEVWITGLDNLPEARPLDQADLRGAIGAGGGQRRRRHAPPGPRKLRLPRQTAHARPGRFAECGGGGVDRVV